MQFTPPPHLALRLQRQARTRLAQFVLACSAGLALTACAVEPCYPEQVVNSNWSLTSENPTVDVNYEFLSYGSRGDKGDVNVASSPGRSALLRLTIQGLENQSLRYWFTEQAIQDSTPPSGTLELLNEETNEKEILFDVGGNEQWYLRVELTQGESVTLRVLARLKDSGGLVGPLDNGEPDCSKFYALGVKLNDE